MGQSLLSSGDYCERAVEGAASLPIRRNRGRGETFLPQEGRNRLASLKLEGR